MVAYFNDLVTYLLNESINMTPRRESGAMCRIMHASWIVGERDTLEPF